MRSIDGSSDLCSSDLHHVLVVAVVLQERIAAVEDDHAVAALERRAVRLQAALEGIEAGIAAGGLAVDARGLRVALAAQLLRVALGLGQDHGAFAVGLGADRLRLDRKSTRLNSSHSCATRMPSPA